MPLATFTARPWAVPRWLFGLLACGSSLAVAAPAAVQGRHPDQYPAAPADAPDPVDRESSAIQAVAIFYPVTDLLNLGDSTENLHDGGAPKSFLKAFAQDPQDLPAWQITGRAMSPIFHVTSALPPTLIFHGDADTLVPLDQSQRFQARAKELGRRVELIIHPGGNHGWLTMMWDVRQFADWFDENLRK